MKDNTRSKFFWFFSLLLFNAFTFAQSSDSVKVKRPSTLNDTWFIASEPERHYVIDTSIFHIEEYNLVQRNGKEYMNIGNTGSAAFPLVFDIDRSTGFNAGYNQFDIYRQKKDSVKYYQVIRPYAQLTMMIGLHNEQMFKGTFANQHKHMVYYGVDFTRISSKGFYSNQKAIDNAVNAYGIYNSKNKRWNVQGDILFNSFIMQENGGVTDDPFNSFYFQKELVPVNLAAAYNRYWQLGFFLTSSYNIGKKYLVRTSDSSQVKTFLPVFKISHQFSIEKNTYDFRDIPVTDESAYYGRFYAPDSAYNSLKYLKIGNEIMLEYRPRKLTSDSSYSEKDFIAYAEAGFDYYLLTQNGAKNNFGNLYVGGAIHNNYASRLKLLYKASVRYFPYGWNQHDLLVDGMAGYDLGPFGILTGNATYQLKEAPYIFERYAYAPVSWQYDLPKTKILNVGGKYQNNRYGITADLNYYVADHLPVYPGSADPYVTGSEENVFVAHLGNRNQVAGVHFDNDVWFSYGTRGGYIQLAYPMLVTKSSVYYEHRILKKVLWFALGFDVRYRLQNNAPYYDPLLASFYPSYTNLKSFPVVDFFVNLKIKTVRVFLKVDNLTSLVGLQGYYSAYQYPAADFSFHAGVMWRFFE